MQECNSSSQNIISNSNPPENNLTSSTITGHSNTHNVESITEEEFLTFEIKKEDVNSEHDTNQIFNRNQPYITENKYNNNVRTFNTDSYYIFRGKIKMNWDRTVKAALVDKYFRMKHETEYHFYGKQIKKSYELQSFNNIKELFGIYMLFQNNIKKDVYLSRFEKYFKIVIKTYETKNSFKSRVSKDGKSMFIGGDLKNQYNLSFLLKEEFSDLKKNNKPLPLYMAVYTYNEYEFIDLDGYDLCGKPVDFNGFSQSNEFNKGFNQDFRRKMNRIKNERNQKIQNVIRDEKNSNVKNMNDIISEEIPIHK